MAQDLTLLVVLAGGTVGGLVLLARGLGAYRTAGRIGGLSPSRIVSIAAGEVLVSGTAEAIELTLVSPLQSAPCLYYRATVNEGGDSDTELFRDERAVGFRIRDATGAIRIFPSEASFDVPDRFDGQGGRWGDDPPGLQPRTGSVFGPGIDRESQIAALLTVRDPARDPWSTPFAASGPTALGLATRPGMANGRRRYREARVEAGDVVTVVGQALPFGDLSEPDAANVLDGAVAPASDPEIAADLAAARAAGTLASTPDAAWGNAAIEGFGIGKPVRSPALDPAATPPPPPDPGVAARAKAAFDIAPTDLVIARTSDMPLLVSLGAPAAVTGRRQQQLYVGLIGAIVAIASAMALALLIGGPG